MVSAIETAPEGAERIILGLIQAGGGKVRVTKHMLQEVDRLTVDCELHEDGSCTWSVSDPAPIHGAYYWVKSVERGDIWVPALSWRAQWWVAGLSSPVTVAEVGARISRPDDPETVPELSEPPPHAMRPLSPGVRCKCWRFIPADLEGYRAHGLCCQPAPELRAGAIGENRTRRGVSMDVTYPIGDVAGGIGTFTDAVRQAEADGRAKFEPTADTTASTADAGI